jgi:hypothetical protein
MEPQMSIIFSGEILKKYYINILIKFYIAVFGKKIDIELKVILNKMPPHYGSC